MSEIENEEYINLNGCFDESFEIFYQYVVNLNFESIKVIFYRERLFIIQDIEKITFFDIGEYTHDQYRGLFDKIIKFCKEYNIEVINVI